MPQSPLALPATIISINITLSLLVLLEIEAQNYNTYTAGMRNFKKVQCLAPCLLVSLRRRDWRTFRLLVATKAEAHALATAVSCLDFRLHVVAKVGERRQGIDRFNARPLAAPAARAARGGVHRLHRSTAVVVAAAIAARTTATTVLPVPHAERLRPVPDASLLCRTRLWAVATIKTMLLRISRKHPSSFTCAIVHRSSELSMVDFSKNGKSQNT